MTRVRLLLLLGVAFLFLLIGVGAGAWWYLYGTNEVDAADLVPANSIAFATIPNAVRVFQGYQTSQLKTLADSPNIKPLFDTIVNLVGQKNIDLLQAFLPNLSGQSFIAVTHFDYDHPAEVGLIAGMKPKAGMGDFDSFIEKLKATWPDTFKQGIPGTGTVAGVDYKWIRGPGASDKICVAQYRGWIITSWGEASLQDWIERYRKQSTTSNLSQDLDYRKSTALVGDDPMTLVYFNFHLLVKTLQQQMATTNPAAGNYLAQKLDSLGGAALGTWFENGKIVDRFSFVLPRPAQIDSGVGSDPCPFETLQFTGPDTRLYWASSINWKQYCKNIREQTGQQPATVNPMANSVVDFLQNWLKGTNLDARQNIINSLGSEVSLQAEWSQDTPWPEVGLFVKLDKPDDFKPTVSAIIDSVRQAYSTTAVIRELSSNGRSFAVLKFVQPSAISPTITEDGPYLGVFLTENQAVRSFQRDASIGLTHRPEFNEQIGDKRNAASQLVFLDSPYLLDRAYQTAMPYISLAGMFDKNLTGMLKGRTLPPDLTWLAPMGAWTCVLTPDEDGIKGYSVSGIGNQGILLGGAMSATANLLQSMGFLPKTMQPAIAAPSAAAPPASMPAAPASDQTNAASAIAPTGSNSVDMPTPPASTNAATNSMPLSNSDATPATSAPILPQ
jgi:hypothetical protein